MRVLVGLNNKKMQDYLNYTNSFIIGLKDFSINFMDYCIEEIRGIKKEYPHIELFVSINKNIFNDDLPLLEKKLIELDSIKVDGIFFYDLAILSLWKKNHLSVPLVWAQEHMTTNYNTCNYYSDKGCKYVYLSSEITVDEIKEIKKKTNIQLISFLLGYPDVSFTKRKLLTNYFLHNNKEKNNNWYTIKSDENNKYYVKENDLGTRILYGKLLNGIKPLFDLYDVIDYALLSEDMMEHDTFIRCLDIYKKMIDGKMNKDEAFLEIKKTTGSGDTVFYYKKTVYKVKNENKD